MKLEQLSCSLIRRAIDLYLAHAWPTEGTNGIAVDLEPIRGAGDLTSMLSFFESSLDDTGVLERYTLRLGNVGYPFMKFVVQEHLVDGEYFFSVDTHDNLNIRPDNPDYLEWERLKAKNRVLKAEIETAWHTAQLPTNVDLCALMEEIAKTEPRACAADARRRILVVDDETPLAQGIAACLGARGYEVTMAHDGRRAVEALAADELPDLVLLDFEMPELDGQAVLEHIRADPRTQDLPVLMATASEIDLARLSRVSGFLAKPYPREVLFEMISRLLAPPTAPGDD